MLYEAIDYRDPCSIMMEQEGDEGDDERESVWSSGCSVSRGERERDIDGHDMRGASPAELAEREFSVDDN